MAETETPMTIKIGVTYRRTITWRDKDGVLVPLAGWFARMQIRPSIDSDTVLIELTTENGRITLTDPGTIELLIPPSASEAADWPVGTNELGRVAVYDLEMYTAGDADVVRLLKGPVMISRGVTRA